MLVVPLLAVLLAKDAVPAASRDQEIAFGIEVARKGLWNEARFRFERAVALDPESAEALNDLGGRPRAAGRVRGRPATRSRRR